MYINNEELGVSPTSSTGTVVSNKVCITQHAEIPQSALVKLKYFRVHQSGTMRVRSRGFVVFVLRHIKEANIYVRLQ